MMKTKNFLIVLLLLTYSATYAQLSGTRTIGGTGADYATFTLAVSALHTQGVNGAVVFNVASGTYNEKISIGVISGANANNTITFQSATGDSTSVILSEPSSSSVADNYTLRLINTTQVHFKSMTIRRTGTLSNTTVVDISGQSNYISFTSCRIEGQSTTSLSIGASAIMANTANTNTNILFEKCVVENGSYGLYIEGQGSGVSFLHNHNKLYGNHFINQYHTAIRLAYQNAPEFNDNIVSSNSTYHSYTGLYAFYCANATRVLRNKFDVFSGRALYIHNSNGSSVLRGLVGNNFIAHGGSAGSAILIENSHTHNIYHNSLNAYASANSVRLIQISGLITAQLHFGNNNLINTGSGYIYHVDTNTNTPIASSNYNNVLTNGSNFAFYKASGNLTSRAAWQTATTFDANSMSALPAYVSNTDLHVTGNVIDKKGTNALLPPLINDDINGTPRSNTKPDIGAHEIYLDDIGVSYIALNQSSFCIGDVVSVWLHVVNYSNYEFNGDFSLHYSIGSIILRNFNYYNQMIPPGDTLFFNLSSSDTLFSTGVYDFKAWSVSPEDINRTNDSLSHPALSVNTYPVVNLGSDTLLCGHHSISLDAGAGFSSYMWSTGDTSQTLTLDTNNIGYGMSWVKVTAANNGCKTSDSLRVTFVDCTFIFEKENPAFNAFISPNPLEYESLLYIDYDGIKTVELSVYDAYGRLLFSDITGEKIYSIGEKNLAPGIYFLNIRSDRNTLTIKFIKR